MANRDSFKHIRERWLPELEHFAPNTAKVLVGLKADLRTRAGDDGEGSRFVSRAEGDALAAEMGASYQEVSSLAGTGLRELEQHAISLFVARAQNARARRDHRCRHWLLRRFFGSCEGSLGLGLARSQRTGLARSQRTRQHAECPGSP